MEEYKKRMIEEAIDLSKKIYKLETKINEFENDDTFDPIELSLMKNQLKHMHNYFGALLIRAECTFKPNEFEEMEEMLNGTN